MPAGDAGLSGLPSRVAVLRQRLLRPELRPARPICRRIPLRDRGGGARFPYPPFRPPLPGARRAGWCCLSLCCRAARNGALQRRFGLPRALAGKEERTIYISVVSFSSDNMILFVSAYGGLAAIAQVNDGNYYQVEQRAGEKSAEHDRSHRTLYFVARKVVPYH